MGFHLNNCYVYIYECFKLKSTFCFIHKICWSAGNNQFIVRCSNQDKKIPILLSKKNLLHVLLFISHARFKKANIDSISYFKFIAFMNFRTNLKKKKYCVRLHLYFLIIFVYSGFTFLLLHQYYHCISGSVSNLNNVGVWVTFWRCRFRESSILDRQSNY